MNHNHEDTRISQVSLLPQNRLSAIPKNSGYLILIVDDLAEVRVLKKEILEWEGFRVIEAENGREGIEAAARERPRLILMNYLMPIMNGLEATKAIRKLKELEGVPILMNSACSREEMLERALQAGCNEFLEEPTNIRELIRQVHAHVLVG
jgi:CheY-like chemotaxis protein